MGDLEPLANNRVPTLVQLCQRVASSCIDSIATLGDDLSYPLVKPILERCTAEQLFVLEDSSPHLFNETPEIWMQICIRKYPTAVEKYLDDDLLEPRPWRERYQVLTREEEHRFERLGSKLKAQRIEAEERKKEREVKLTDRVPPLRRPKAGGWSVPLQPKTLIQKTLSEASKIQKAMYQSRMFPPMNGGKAHRVLSKPSCTLTSSTSADFNRVSVNTVPKRAIPGPSNRVTPPQAPSSSLTPQQSYDNNSQTTSPGFALVPTVVVSDATTATQKQSNTPPKKLPTASPSTSTDARPMKPAPPLRKDPMASLFVPKHRAYSQRPV